MSSRLLRLLRVSAQATLGAILFFGATACGPSKSAARAYLEEQGLTNIELTPNKKSFDFTATQDTNFCKGSVTVTKGFGTSNKSFTKTCGLDTRTCKAGMPQECVRLADQLYGMKAKIFPIEAAPLYRTACADKDGHACARVAEFEAIGPTPNWAAVRDFAKQGCDLANADACAQLGFAELHGDGGPVNEANALLLFRKSCPPTSPSPSIQGCRAAAGLLLDMHPPNNTEALPLAERVCNAKYGDGCIVYGLALYRTKDYARALPDFEVTCPNADLKNHGMACNLAGAIYFDGLVGKKDLVKGTELFEKGCEAGDSDGCTNAARSYAKGLGVKSDKAKAADFTAKAAQLTAK